MPTNISISFSRISIIIKNLFNWLNRNTTRRMICVFEMSIKNEAFSFEDSAYKFDQHIACHNLSLLSIIHKSH